MLISPWDAYSAMIPKAEGDSSLLGQGPLRVLPVVYCFWTSVPLSHIQDWFCSWVPDSTFGACTGGSSVDASYSTTNDTQKRSLLMLAKETCKSSLVMLPKPLTRWIVAHLIVLKEGSSFRPGFVGYTLHSMVKFVLCSR